MIKGVLLLCLLAGPARAWNGSTHSALARLSLASDPSMRGTAIAETLDAFLATQGQTAASFVRDLRINPATSFFFKIPGETPGASVRVLDIFSAYVNEPDWGMDQGICAAYPGTCSQDLRFMGAFETGLPSQAFRHMYWPTGYIKIFKKFLPIPIHEDKPIGEAARRCQLFFDWSVRAGRAGHPYWAARFLAWSMHYAQDVTQPFHAAQLPSKKLEFKDHKLIPNVRKTVKKLTYYHLAFEDYIAALLEGQAGLGSQGQTIEQALKGSISRDPDLPQATAEAVAQAAAAHSVSESFAKRAGDAAVKFFPPIPDIAHADVERYLKSDEFRRELSRRSQPGPVLDEFVAIAGSCLAVGGAASRTLLDLYFRQVQPGTAAPALPAGVASRVQARFSALALGLN